jgi:saccharopine dehydrogenase-like NADP-dependent oxidoreductase
MKKYKVCVLGAGMVGSAMAKDLSEKFEVTACDLNKENLRIFSKSIVNTIQADLSNRKEIQKLVSGFDFVVGALPGFMGFESVKNVIEAGKNIVDISFFPEDAFELDKLAKKNNVTAIVDFGVAPGMSNFILGYYYNRMKVNKFDFMVGGLPKVREWPFQYKAPFSPVDVIEEYTRPARMMENGKVVTKEALSEPELIYFDEIGTLEAFNTDGLRSLLKTMKIPDMKEKTLRYPGYRDIIAVLKSAGFLSTDELLIGENKIKPIDVTSKLLFKQWKLHPGEDEFTVMRINISGIQEKKAKDIQYDLLDWNDKTKGISSMARTTGYSGTAALNLLAGGLYGQKGIVTPEFIGSDEKCFNFVLKYLKQRGVNYIKTEK